MYLRIVQPTLLVKDLVKGKRNSGLSAPTNFHVMYCNIIRRRYLSHRAQNLNSYLHVRACLFFFNFLLLQNQIIYVLSLFFNFFF